MYRNSAGLRHKTLICQLSYTDKGFVRSQRGIKEIAFKNVNQVTQNYISEERSLYKMPRKQNTENRGCV
jgi:hypothetical protein